MSKRLPTSLQRQVQGMTLIEVLVALVIIAVALAATIRSTNVGVANTVYLKQRTVAHWVAMNETVELELIGDRVEGEGWQDKEMGGYDWQLRTRLRSTSDRDVLRGEISVFRSGDRDNALADVVIYVARPQ